MPELNPYNTPKAEPPSLGQANFTGSHRTALLREEVNTGVDHVNLKQTSFASKDRATLLKEELNTPKNSDQASFDSKHMPSMTQEVVRTSCFLAALVIVGHMGAKLVPNMPPILANESLDLIARKIVCSLPAAQILYNYIRSSFFSEK